MRHFGFSDHMPLRFPDGSESHYRVPFSEGKAYYDLILSFREKYKDKLDINVGFEMEYYPEYFQDMLNSAKAFGAQYLILGQHYLEPENNAIGNVLVETKSKKELKKYTDTVISAMRTGVFTYVAHPDIFNFSGDIGLYRKETQRLACASRELNIPLEINFLGMRDGRHYPKDDFWQIVGEEKAPVTFGFDAHTVESAFDKESILRAKEIVKKHNLNYIGKPDLILIQNF